MYGQNKDGIAQTPLIDSERKIVTLSTFAEAVREGNCYSGANPTAVVFTVGLSATYTGLALANPIGSGKILRLLAAGWSEIKASTGISDYWIGTGYHASTNATIGSEITATNLRVGGSLGVGKVLDDSQFPVNPTYAFPIMTGHTSAALSTSAAPGLVRIDGLVALPPGAFAAIINFTVGVAGGGKGAILWQEIDA
jgi:hypothetical protein